MLHYALLALLGRSCVLVPPNDDKYSLHGLHSLPSPDIYRRRTSWLNVSESIGRVVHCLRCHRPLRSLAA
jgi:hypothetical protein